VQAVYQGVLATRPALAPLRAAVLASTANRRAAAADLAFDGRDLAAMRRTQAMLPPGHPPAVRRAKGWISRLATPACAGCGQLASRLAPLGGQN